MGQEGGKKWTGFSQIAADDPKSDRLLAVHNAPDSEIMAYASKNDYVVLTHDLDFGAILAATHGEKPSVVQIRAGDVSPNAIGKQVIMALRQMASELETGALIIVDPTRARLRVLPLRL